MICVYDMCVVCLYVCMHVYKANKFTPKIKTNSKIRTAKRILMGGPSPPDVKAAKQRQQQQTSEVQQQLHRHAMNTNVAIESTVSLESGFASEQGLRRTMEDAHVVIDDLCPLLPVPTSGTYAFFGVYDGMH